MSGFRIGCDVGGTFTDFILFDAGTGAVATLKLPTTPGAPERAVLDGLATLGRAHPGLGDGLRALIHGTTLVINAIIERRGARTALIANEGFRDVLETRREIRYDIYDIRQTYPEPVVPRDLRREVSGRLRHDGAEETPLDREGARAVLAALAAEGVESVAVCLLHAYACDRHERAVAEVAAALGAPFDVTLSCEVLPELGEFERTATTALNAYVRPLADRYLGRLEAGLAEAGHAAPLLLMQSGGGIMTTAPARRAPVRLAESGPVGGVLAARDLAAAAGHADVLAFDVGGTTAKACLVRGGALPVTRAYEVDRVHRFKRGSGTPMAVPTVDLIEVGAGGGSIARVDALGLLAVGPRSAGAEPGPACYGLGGGRATVTDANLVLGYLDPAEFRAGGIALDRPAAEAAIARDVAGPLGLGVTQAAAAIVALADETMAGAARIHAAERGADPSRAVMVAHGGGGPLHALAVARKLGVARVLVPEAAGVFSALGFLRAPPTYEVARSRPARLADVSQSALDAAFDELALEAGAVVRLAAGDVEITRKHHAEMRYVGQGHRLRVRLDDTRPDAVARAFAAAYRDAYGHAYDDMEPEIVTLCVTCEAPATGPPFARTATAGGEAAHRPAWDPALAAMVPHHVVPFGAMDGAVEGPAILAQEGATILVARGARAERAPGGWLEIETGVGA